MHEMHAGGQLCQTPPEHAQLGILHGKKMRHAPCHPHETQEHACAKAIGALVLALEQNFGVVGMSKFGHF